MASLHASKSSADERASAILSRAFKALLRRGERACMARALRLWRGRGAATRTKVTATLHGAKRTKMKAFSLWRAVAHAWAVAALFSENVKLTADVEREREAHQRTSAIAVRAQAVAEAVEELERSRERIMSSRRLH
jgi:hypothetical protein